MRCTLGPIALRRATPALARGSFALLDGPEGVLAYRRSHGGDAVDVFGDLLLLHGGKRRTGPRPARRATATAAHDAAKTFQWRAATPVDTLSLKLTNQSVGVSSGLLPVLFWANST